MRASVRFALCVSLALAFASPAAFARVSDKQCASDDEVVRQSQACRERGLSALVEEDANKCKTVSCTSTIACPDDAKMETLRAACTSQGQGFTYVTDANNCRNVQCTSQNTCKPQTDLDAVARNCALQGRGWETKEDGLGCKVVECTLLPPSTTGATGNGCPDLTMLRTMMMACRAKGLGYQTVNDGTCRTIRCDGESASSSSAQPTPPLPQPQLLEHMPRFVSYKDTKDGFRLQYPTGWKVNASGTGVTIVDPTTSIVIIGYQLNPEKLTLRQTADAGVSGFVSGMTNPTIKAPMSMRIAGQPALQIPLYNLHFGSSPLTFDGALVFVNSNEKGHMFGVFLPRGLPHIYDLMARKILRSFRPE